jgi:hypothetical protein
MPRLTDQYKYTEEKLQNFHKKAAKARGKMVDFPEEFEES